MPKLKIKGKVLYMNMAPVPNADVEITDLDVNGRHDLILKNVKTDADGDFSGTSTEWQDADSASAGPITVPVPDVMTLEFKVSKAGKTHKGPFIFVGDNLPSIPIVLPWLPPSPIAKVNGKACYTGDQISSKMHAEIKQGHKITMNVYGTEGQALLVLGKPANELRDRIREKAPQTSNVTGVEEAAGVALIILAVAILIIAVGASLVLLAIGIGLIIAIGSGYKNISVQQRTETNTEGQQVTYTELVLEK